jgi:hypothetical protein
MVLMAARNTGRVPNPWPRPGALSALDMMRSFYQRSVNL